MELGGYREEIEYAQDYDLVLRRSLTLSACGGSESGLANQAGEAGGVFALWRHSGRRRVLTRCAGD